jgi:protein-S-isoprenylcysteine O-methyltransferase Ste14
MTSGWVTRHGLALLVLPVTVVLVIPTWIARASGTEVILPDSPIDWAAAAIGLASLGLGATLFLASLMRFGSEGMGTLAPWDPPARLVVRGPYAFVRNPMISGVVFLLLAEGLLLRSVPHLEWAALFAAINAVYIPLLEEPQLRARFGREYDEYAKGVPRLIPRTRPWRRADDEGGLTRPESRP